MSSQREEILAEDFAEGILTAMPGGVDAESAPTGGRILTLSNMEAEYIRSVLRSVKGNKSKAARLLGISRKALYDKIEISAEELQGGRIC